MTGQKYCPKCQDWYPSEIYGDHMKQHNVGINSDSNDNNNRHFSEKKNDDYMVCVLHQKKTPCPVRGCKLMPFGCIKKNLMMEYFKRGFWHWSDRYGKPMLVPIDTETKIVVLYGVPIRIRV